jgi:hypothetical protein
MAGKKSSKWGWWLLFAAVVVAVLGVVFVLSDLYPAAAFRSWLCGWPMQWSLDVGENYRINSESAWKVVVKEHVDACANLPGLKRIYVEALDEDGLPLPDIKVRFDTEPSRGLAYDHFNIYGVTDGFGWLEWDHLGVSTRYLMWVEDEAEPLIANIRVDLGNEYCRPGSVSPWNPQGWRPVNHPGWHSHRFVIQRKEAL